MTHSSPADGKVLGARIRYFRKARGISQQEMAKALEVSNSAVTNWETGLNRPDLSTLLSLCQMLGITPDILLGLRQPLPPEEERFLQLWAQLSAGSRITLTDLAASLLRREEEDFYRQCRENFLPLPVSPDRVCAGNGVMLSGGDTETLFVRRTGESECCDLLLRVTGHSMEPIYADGDLLMIRYAPALRTGDIGIFTVQGEGTVKQYLQSCLHPFNPAYPDIPVTEDVRCVGQVLGAVTAPLLPTEKELPVLEDLLAEGLLPRPASHSN